ncbi:alginate lyase family protein [bacterium]|nr:alginate lyase family protein [bacterium]
MNDTDGSSTPRVFLLSAKSLARVKQRVAAGDEALQPAIQRLRRDADKARRMAPVSVMDKKAVPPSGDRHDYMSRGPYWWPDPKKPGGLPYIRRDGEVNRESRNLDSRAIGRMTGAVDTLALAYYLTGHEPYAAQAATLLRVWFLDDATRMNPHLQYGQGIPGRCDGRGIGIIDTTRLVQVVDAMGLLAGSQAWTAADQTGMEDWFRRYLKWLLDSGHGRAEARTTNNHGTWYDVQVATFALFTRQPGVAKRVLQASAKRRIAAHIEPDGRQPRELARTKSFDYSTMNLTGLFHLARLGEHVDIGLWRFETPDGRGLRKALDWLLAFATGEQKWQHKQIGGLHPERLLPLLRRAAIAYGEPCYEAAIAKLEGDDRSGRERLLYPKP